MADIETTTAGLTTLAGGGHIVVLSDDATPAPLRLPVADVSAAAALATTAVQPGDLGTAAYADVEDFASAAEMANIAAALAAILAGGD